MDKNVTLRGISEENYNTFKSMAEKQNITISQMFSQLISPENLMQKQVNNEENEDLHNQIKELQTEIEGLQANINTFKEVNNGLHNEKTTLENIIETLKNQIQDKENTIVNTNGFLLDFTGFDLLILKLICKQESERTGKIITPAILLKSMFLSYVMEEKTYYFDTPTYFKLKRLQKDFEEGKISIEDFNI